MHTHIPLASLLLWIALVCGEFFVGCFADNRTFLRTYLFSEAILGATLIVIARTLTASAYRDAWTVGLFVDQLLTCLLLAGILNRIRERGLPRRRSVYPIYFGIFVSLATGIHSSGLALVALSSSPWKLLFSWDHAFWYGCCCLILFLPLYVWLISSSLPRPLFLTTIGMAFYAIAHSGFLDLMIVSRHRGELLAHSADLVYLLSLLLWFCASRIPTTTHSLLRNIEN